MGEVIGIAVNLDELQPPNFRGTLTQDYRDVHAKCEVTFAYPAKLGFAEGVLFVWMGHVWEAVSYRSFEENLGDPGSLNLSANDAKYEKMPYQFFG